MDTLETCDIRPGEELNDAALWTYLENKLGAAAGPRTIVQFPSGSSNLTYLLTFGQDEYVLRRPPFGNTVKTAHDMRREFGVLSKLSRVYPPAPKPALFCDDESVIGSEFYLMERRNGLIIRGQNQSHLRERVGSTLADRFGASRDYQKEVCKSFIRNLSDLHKLDHKAAGLIDLGKPEGYPRRRVEGWTKRYFGAKTDDHEELEAAIDWLNKNVPSESGGALVHNDYKFDNIMLDPTDFTRITAVLDWEMVTVGDPLMDLGTTLGYWMSPDAGEEMMRMPFNPYVLMKNVSRAELVEMYAAASGRDVSNMLFYYVFGTFKIAVIAQQIYARFVKGFTKDERFADFSRFVSALGMIAANTIERAEL